MGYNCAETHLGNGNYIKAICVILKVGNFCSRGKSILQGACGTKCRIHVTVRITVRGPDVIKKKKCW
jgi:hypothetical protein